ncbi:MAG: hypothetical protein P8Y58_02270 [Novosphingobium sp.]
MGDKQAAPYRTHQPSRWLRNLILLAIVAALAVLGWNWTRLREEALVGSAYGAARACRCSPARAPRTARRPAASSNPGTNDCLVKALEIDKRTSGFSCAGDGG